MAKQQTSTTATRNLKRAWKHIISTAVFGNKSRAMTVVGMSILTTIVQMAAMLTLVMAARAYEQKGIVDLGPIHLNLNEGGGVPLFLVVGGALFILLSSVFIGLFQQIIITRIGRKFFEEALDDTRGRVRDLAKKGAAYQSSSFMRMLQRDSRYLSISYMRTLNLLQPGLLVIVFMSYAIYSMPMVAIILVIGCLAMLPFHIWMSKWSAQTSEDIQDAARLKSAEERDYLAGLGTDPFSADWDERYKMPDRPVGERGFITAFVKRQRIGAYSQFITDAAMAIIVVVIVTILAKKSAASLLSLSSIMILLILFRLLTGYVSKFAQAVTMVSSYEPFFRELLDLHEGRAPTLHTHLRGELRTPIRLVAFQNGSLARGDGQFYAQTLGQGGAFRFVNGDYETRGRRSKMAIPETFDPQEKFDYDPALANELTVFLEDDTQELSSRARYLLAFEIALAGESDVILMAGGMWDKMHKNDVRYMVPAVQGRHLVLVYDRPPGKLVLPPRFQIAIRDAKGLEIVGGIDTYQEKRPEIVKSLAKSKAAQSRVPLPVVTDEID